ncbi:MAG: hypothetical protein ACOYN2_06675 [Patescibacteria group bacterium]
MKFSRLFLISILVCFGISILSAYLMVRFVAGHIETMPVTKDTKENITATTDVPTISPKLADLESGVK